MSKAVYQKGFRSFDRRLTRTKWHVLQSRWELDLYTNCVKKDSNFLISPRPKTEFETEERLKKYRAKVKTYFAKRK